MDAIVINGLPREEIKFICMQTFKKTCIRNEQRRYLIKDDENIALMVQEKYNSKYRGTATPMYNCHGLTFACRRTGIYDSEMLDIILKEEYREIKDRKGVVSGDIVTYIKFGIIVHSGMVLSNDGLIIKVLSKEPRYKEIEHLIDYTPHVGAEQRYYRINHDVTQII